MPRPTPLIGVIGGPPKTPARLPVHRLGSGSGGGGGGGLVPNPIRGVSIAFGSSINDENPLWQDLRTLGET